MKKFIALLALLAGCVDSSVKKPYEEKDLTTEEIRKKLNSGDFRQKLEASKQINKLEPADKLRVLLILADDEQASTRLLAVKKLRKIEDAQAKDKLKKMAKDDPDADVRELAAGGF